MSQDAFICYSPEDENIALDVSNLLEDNGISNWIKKRDFKDGDTVFTISEAVRNSQIFILIYSENAKKSNFVVTELDIAFSSDVPILTFNIDNSDFEGKFLFYLKDKPSIDAQEGPELKYDELLEDVTVMLDKGDMILTNDIIANDISATIDDYPDEVYICFSEEDSSVSDAICRVLEENNIKCWIKSRDLGVNETVFRISEVIKDSKCFVLVYSKNAEKSNFVKAEVEIASSAEKPILSYNIDENVSFDDVSENLKNQHWIDSFPNPKENFQELVRITSNLMIK